MNSKLLNNSIIYTTFSVLQKALGFFLLPLYTAYLVPEEYGKVGVVTSVTAVLAILLSLALRGAVTRRYFSYRDDEVRVKRIWGACFTLTMVNGLFWTAGITLFHLIVGREFFTGVPFLPYLLLGLCSALLNSVFQLYQSSLQARQLSLRFTRNNLAFFLINIALILLLVIGFKLAALGVILAITLTNLIFFIFTLVVWLPEITPNLGTEEVRDVLAYSFPLIPHALATWAANMINRIFINQMVSTASVGIYDVGFQFGNILNLVAIGVNQAYGPWFFECHEDKRDRSGEIRRAGNTLIRVYSYLAMTISFLAPIFLSLFIPETYRQAWVVIAPLSFAYVFNGLYFIVVGVIFLERTRYIPFITVSAAGIGLLANWRLIGMFGMVGSAYASLITFFVSAVIASIVSRRVARVGYSFFTMFTTALLGCAVTWLGSRYLPTSGRLAVVVAGAALLFYLDRKTLLQLLRRKG